MIRLCLAAALSMRLLTGAADAAIGVELVASGLPNIVGIYHAGDGSNRLFLVGQGGVILIYVDGEVLGTPYLNISSLVTNGSEQGLLGLAFHPDYESNGRFFVNYTNAFGDTVVARYEVSGNPNVADPDSAQVILTVDQPFANHNGGDLRFGPDGFLYIALGDGGSGGDPQNHGQRLETLLGKILRIDIDNGAPYAIPADNPFVDTPGARGEIWIFGLRNPWRFTFDRVTGDMFIADVGQGVWEEVDFVSAGSSGENFGWRVREGRHCYPPSTTTCSTTGLTDPILEYSHTLGCSVTGGARYRGTTLPEVSGHYLFADYCSGRVWSATPDGSGVWRAVQEIDTSLSVSTFGEDEAGEVYLADRDGSGALYRLVSRTAATLIVARRGSGDGVVTSSSATGLECGDVCGTRLSPGTDVALTVTANGDSVFVRWSGDADCVDGSVTMSADRTCTATFGLAFTDQALASGAVIRAVHITELRARIDALRMREALAPVSWTTATLVPGVTVAQAAHVTEMRSALAQVYSAISQEPPIYTDPALTAGAPIRAVHVTELRTAVMTVE